MPGVRSELLGVMSRPVGRDTSGDSVNIHVWRGYC